MLQGAFHENIRTHWRRSLLHLFPHSRRVARHRRSCGGGRSCRILVHSPRHRLLRWHQPLALWRAVWAQARRAVRPQGLLAMSASPSAFRPAFSAKSLTDHKPSVSPASPVLSMKAAIRLLAALSFAFFLVPGIWVLNQAGARDGL